jgi:cytochrome c oxidase assembly protein subunit 15
MRPSLSGLNTYRRLTSLNVVLLAAVVVTGATVRLTDSGLGCADWPNCTADSFISIDSQHSAIEQLNRIFSGAIGIPLVLALVAAHRLRPRRGDLVSLSWWMLGLFLANAVLGGISVLVRLAWLSVMGHFLLAIALVGVALVAHQRAREADGRRVAVVSRRVRGLTGAVYVLTVAVLVLGTMVTAAGPHGGDAEAERLSWSITSLARTHAVTVDVLVLVVLALVVVAVRERAPRRVLTATSVTLAAMVVQGTIGYVQYAQGIPELLVGLHVFGAVLVFGSVQRLVLSQRETAASVAPASDARQSLAVAALP